MGYIYKIVNNKNNKIYIGQTIKSIQERFRIHITASKLIKNNNIPLYQAFKKYGLENFKILLIEECDKLELNNREQYWINYYNSYNKGYNATLGGKSRLSNNYEEIVKTYNINLNIRETSNIMKCCKNTVSNALKSKNIKINKKLTGNAFNPISINQIEITTNELMNKFDSLSEASKWLIKNNKTKSKYSYINLIKCAKGIRKSAYGYKWIFS